MNGWIEDIQAASGGSSSFAVTGTDSISADSPRNGGFFNDSLIDVNQDSDVYYSQANPNAGASLADPSVVTNLNPGMIIAAFSETCGVQGSASLSSAGDFNYSVVTLASCGPMGLPIETPVPASLWLFASALFASAGFRCRQDRRQR